MYASAPRTRPHTPPALSNFTVSTGPKDGEVTLKWNSAESHWNVWKYHVWLIKKGQKGYGTEKTVNNDKNSYVFSNLEHGVEYTGRVQYSTEPITGSLSRSELAVAHGRAKASAPGQVMEVTATPGLRSVAVSWNKVASKPNITISGYRVTWVSGDFNHGTCLTPPVALHFQEGYRLQGIR